MCLSLNSNMFKLFQNTKFSLHNKTLPLNKNKLHNQQTNFIKYIYQQELHPLDLMLKLKRILKIH
jgi:hypothetical protein